uniref:Uncharacterized protein n=1 Tax=Myotis myotis TaxID=51298 RepID=A0A7J7UPG0_MYOMY|nr:hypothetical protein mMyoMyo1_008551 [Myotis myotis]
MSWRSSGEVYQEVALARVSLLWPGCGVLPAFRCLSQHFQPTEERHDARCYYKWHLAISPSEVLSSRGPGPSDSLVRLALLHTPVGQQSLHAARCQLHPFHSTLPVGPLNQFTMCRVPGAWDPLLSPSGVTKSMASPLKKLGSDSVPLGTSQRRSWEHASGSQICSVLLFL